LGSELARLETQRKEIIATIESLSRMEESFFGNAGDTTALDVPKKLAGG